MAEPKTAEPEAKPKDIEDRPPKFIPVRPPGQKEAEGEPSAKVPPRKPSQRPRGRPTSLERRLESMFLSIALVVSVVNEEDGKAIGESSDTLAKSWSELANENAKVKKAIERLLEGGAFGKVLFAHAVLIFQIARNHGLLEGFSIAGMFGGFEEEPEPDVGG